METPSEEGTYLMVAVEKGCHIGSPVCVAALPHTSWWTPGNGSRSSRCKPRGPGTAAHDPFIYAPTQISALSCRLLPRDPGDFSLPACLLRLQCTLIWIPCALFKKEPCKYEHLNENSSCKGDKFTWLWHLQRCDPRVCSQRPWKAVT